MLGSEGGLDVRSEVPLRGIIQEAERDFARERRERYKQAAYNEAGGAILGRVTHGKWQGEERSPPRRNRGRAAKWPHGEL